MCALTCMCECVSTNPETMSTTHSVSPELLPTLNLLISPLSIMFQMSFLHLLSLLAWHSVSCILLSLCSLRTLFVTSLPCPLSLTCPTSILLHDWADFCMTKPLNILSECLSLLFSREIFLQPRVCIHGEFCFSKAFCVYIDI